jgi:diguanylate cyclase (GGDEF)-like protein/PAS domain S-box-containing protein
MTAGQWGELDFDEFFEHAPVGLHLEAEDGTILRANPAVLAMLGYPLQEYVGRNVAEFHVDPAVARDLLRRLRAGEAEGNLAASLRAQDGSIRRVLISANALFVQGRFIHSRVITRDVTEIADAVQALAQFRAMVESADDAIFAKDLDGMLTYWNRAAERLYGYAAEEVLGKSVSIIIPPERSGELADILARVRRGDRVDHFETTRVRKDGSRFEVSVTISPVFDSAGRPVAASVIARDITERKQAEQDLRHVALHDALTDLPNRLLFNERVAQALGRLRREPDYRFAVLFLDFDDFKMINDSMGHLAGDRLLVEIARRLRAQARPGDLIARLGGDEFTVLLEDVAGSPDVEHAALRIQRSLAAPIQLQGREIFITTSIGAALAGPGYRQPEELLRDADVAMYHAKAQGHAHFKVFDLPMRERAQARLGILTDLRQALDRGEFRLLYQPIVDMQTGRIRAFEALLRWHHPVRGEIQPSEFIPLAEESGLIVPIGAWVLGEACWQALHWRRAAPREEPVRISVNLSVKQLQPRLVEDVRRALAGAGTDPPTLQLEITESVLLGNGNGATDLLTELRMLGVEVHVDDFGTGYSSLSYLQRFHLQAIKVDRSFVHRMGSRRTDLVIVRSIVDLATTLGMGVIAEGVETPAQRERLIAFGCQLGQGFFFAEPLDAAAASALLEAPEPSVPV